MKWNLGRCGMCAAGTVSVCKGEPIPHQDYARSYEMEKTRRKYKIRKDKKAMTTVVSVRITENDKKAIDRTMKNLNITRYSDFMRIALRMVQSDMSYFQVQI
jgi:hypothetical protein